MNVKLINHSQPTPELAAMNITDAQELVAFCARVSNPSNQYNTETSEKLIKYLIKHQHWSPLEMVRLYGDQHHQRHCPSDSSAS